MCVCREREILRNWFTQFWALASLKFAGQAGRKETQGRLMLQLKSKGSLEAEFPLPQGTSVFSFKAFN